MAWSALESSKIHHLRAMGPGNRVFVEELSKQDSQLESSLDVAGDGDALLEERLLSGLPTIQKRR